MGHGLVGKEFIFGSDHGDQEWGPWKRETGTGGSYARCIAELSLLWEYLRSSIEQTSELSTDAQKRGEHVSTGTHSSLLQGCPANSLFHVCTCAR